MSVDNWAIAFFHSINECGLKYTFYHCAFLIVYIGETHSITLLSTTSDERDCPLNLSISLSGEKENNNDS